MGPVLHCQHVKYILDQEPFLEHIATLTFMKQAVLRACVLCWNTQPQVPAACVPPPARHEEAAGDEADTPGGARAGAGGSK
jgi:hypothetical protein